MKILTSEQIRQADAYTIQQEPIASVDLMERAASQCFHWITQRWNKQHQFHVFCGTGNNGGDGLVIARLLAQEGYDVKVFIIRFSDQCSADFLINEKRLEKVKQLTIHNIVAEGETLSQLLKNPKPEDNSKPIFVDAIFGSGLTRPVEGLAADVIHYINQMDTITIAIDIPSGLFSENNKGNNLKNIVKADYTLTFETPKLAFLFAENNSYAGGWHVLPIGLHQQFIAELSSPYFFLTKNKIQPLIKKRNKFSHKGTYGHALLLSGSYGKMGATVLASKACLRAGVGLLTVHIPQCGYSILQTTVPEAMASIDNAPHSISNINKLNIYSAIGIGPGLGMEKETQNALKQVIQNCSAPLVLDADAINILAENKTWMSFLPKNSILTPHPKEFERIAGKTSDSYERLFQQIAFSKKYKVVVVYKGTYTTIACPDGEVYFNSTGNPGMATAGSGDVLTGIITGLLAQGYTPKAASVLGVYLHGLAGDIAAEKYGQEALIAGDIIAHLSEGFNCIRQK